MNTKMILEVAGAKPLAGQTNVAAGAKGLMAEKVDRAVPKNLGISAYGRTGKNPSSYGNRKDAYDSEDGTGAAVGGLGEGMWRGVFGN